MSKVYLDPGHGGSDPGASGNGLQEKIVVLDIAKYSRDYLQNNYSGVSVRMSRTNDSFPSLTDRTNDANSWGADIFVSIHINAFNGSAHGYEDYIFNGNVSNNTPKLQDALHSELAPLFRNNRGKKQANFAVLRQTSMPAVLTENGFIDNAQDADFLKSDSNLQKIAEAHAKGIAAYLGLSGGSSSAISSSSSSSWNSMSDAQKYADATKAIQDAGLTVIQYQQRLINAGHNLPRFGADGTVGAETISATKAFQREYSLSSSSGNFYGRPGPATIKKLNEVASSSAAVAKPTLRNGSQGTEVEKLQKQLDNHNPRFNPRGIDGIYGDDTEDAVLRYQKQYGVKPYDGIYGPKTADKLNETI